MVSGAADFKIRVHDVQARETTMVCSCHTSRVKRLATAASVPFVFWSAAEDGVILQFDYRTPHHCSAESSHVLVNLGYHLGRNVEAKCIAVNQLRPHLIAVGANDSYIRLYDRRMITTTKVRTPAASVRVLSEYLSYQVLPFYVKNVDIVNKLQHPGASITAGGMWHKQ